MFQMRVNFLQHPPKANYANMSIDQIYTYMFWEAELTILYDDYVIFSEVVAIVEYYWYLVNWYRKYLAGEKRPFTYCTVEHSVPILEFLPLGNDCWKIDSIWNKCNKSFWVKETALCSEVRKFIINSNMEN